MVNFATNAFLYSQDLKNIKRQLTFDQSKVLCFILWRQRGKVSKLHNLIFYIIHLSWQRAIFDKCQEKNLVLADYDKIYAIICDSEAR